ncbi:MAG: TnpV protein [Clostridia bacterium]|nr:TnpV protein [Clostridia bacterium]
MKTTNTTQKNLPETVEKNGITYRLMGDVYLPMIGLSAEDSKPLGKWGRMRRTYLKEHRSGTYSEMLLTGTLMQHLSEIEETAERRMEELMESLKKKYYLTEQMKSENQMQWVQMMNNLRATAEEMIQTELIYS